MAIVAIAQELRLGEEVLGANVQLLWAFGGLRLVLHVGRMEGAIANLNGTRTLETMELGPCPGKGGAAVEDEEGVG